MNEYTNNYNSGNTYQKSADNMFDNDGYTMYSSEGDAYGYPGIDFSGDGESRIITELYQVKNLLEEEVIAKSFLFMFCALIITALAALATPPELAATMLHGKNYWFLIIAELGIVFVSNYALNKNNPILVGVLYAAYSYINGMTMAIIFEIFTTTSVVSIFLITASIFGVMAVYGLITKKDLSGVGNLCMMGLLGIVISGVVNLVFLRNTVSDAIICAIGVMVFVGITAYDTQKIKERVETATDENVLVLALYGGFQLYLDFIYLLMKLLRLLGKSKD